LCRATFPPERHDKPQSSNALPFFCGDGPVTPRKIALTERRRAQRFLRDELAHGPKSVTTVEAAASKVHVDPMTLEQARADLGIVTSCSNAGGVQAVQWSLPG